MGEILLDRIQVTPLRRIPTTGGDVFKALMANEDSYDKFGEAYFSQVHQHAIKAWKMHKRMKLNLIVPIGMVRFVFCDQSEGQNIFRILEIGSENYARITVNPGIWFGFQGISSGASLVLNIANIMHDPEEVERRPINEIIYNW